MIRAILPLFLLQASCAAIATGAMADALSGSSGTYARDDDPELIEDALPFALKTMESVLEAEPEHVGLLQASCSGFVQYAAGFIEQRADAIAEDEYDQSQQMRARARKLYRRALGYCLRGLEVDHEGFEKMVPGAPDLALAPMEAEDVPLLYWTAAAWGLSISNDKNNPEAIAQLPTVKKIAERALAIDPDWKRGTLYELMGTLEVSAPGGELEKARGYFEKAIGLSGETRAGPFVSYAEQISVKTQNSKEFHKLLDRALAVDPEASPDDRLANVIMQRRARRLKEAAEDLFLE